MKDKQIQIYRNDKISTFLDMVCLLFAGMEILRVGFVATLLCYESTLAMAHKCHFRSLTVGLSQQVKSNSYELR